MLEDNILIANQMRRKEDLFFFTAFLGICVSILFLYSIFLPLIRNTMKPISLSLFGLETIRLTPQP